jgi:hypothetical protein
MRVQVVANTPSCNIIVIFDVSISRSVGTMTATCRQAIREAPCANTMKPWHTALPSRLIPPLNHLLSLHRIAQPVSLLFPSTRIFAVIFVLVYACAASVCVCVCVFVFV